LRAALARLSRRLRRHELAGLTPTQLAALATVERSGPLRLGDATPEQDGWRMLAKGFTARLSACQRCRRLSRSTALFS